MLLKNFRIRNFRSINDSGDIDASRITALLGRNESGKSNILRGLHSLNPAEGFGALNPIKDFPRHRKLTDCNDSTPVVDSTWELSESEQAELVAIWPRASGVTQVTVSRSYQGKTRSVGIPADVIAFDFSQIRTEGRKIVAAVKAKAAELEETHKSALDAAADAFGVKVALGGTAAKWAEGAGPLLAAVRQALAAAEVNLPDSQDQMITSLEDQAESIRTDEIALQKARNWVTAQLPILMYLDDYPEIRGHQDIAGFLQRKTSSTPTPADKNFDKLCKVAGLDPTQLQTLLQSNDQETRSQLANRAGAVGLASIKWRVFLET